MGRHHLYSEHYVSGVPWPPDREYQTVLSTFFHPNLWVRAFVTQDKICEVIQ